MSSTTAGKRLLRDRLATVLVNTVGLGTVALVLLILWYLFSVALPLAQPFAIAPPTTVGGEQLPQGRGLTFEPTDGALRLNTETVAGDWSFSRDGAYACAAVARPFIFPAVIQRPLRAVSAAENGAVLLILDAASAVHRMALPASGRCRLEPMGPALQLSFDAGFLLAEVRRPVAIAVASSGERMQAWTSTTGATLYDGRIPAGEGIRSWRMAPAGEALYGGNAEGWLRWSLANRFPEAGAQALWRPVHYGGYEGPEHIWHPGDGGEGALAKYGLTPLLWGTFKAALYGMLVAVPIAFGAAIYTGYLLPQRLRNRVKPTVELLEAVPTVVLGFFAGLWLAPMLADYLLVLFLLPLLLVLVPLALAGGHLLLQQLDSRFRRRPPRIFAITVAYLVTVIALFSYSGVMEQSLFGGNLRDWLLEVAGLHYEQRNALLVGLAMGFALVPTLFSIVEDAVFAVPRSLSDGSLALGATRWQSLSRVVLPAASPAILSALLIGLARGLGETMIVLLATGNTPIMDASAFNGMRSLAASLAAELPEAAVGGTQFRVLFLASLVLFGLTFLLNTLAELFRQRLRYRYAGR